MIEENVSESVSGLETPTLLSLSVDGLGVGGGLPKIVDGTLKVSQLVISEEPRVWSVRVSDVDKTPDNVALESEVPGGEMKMIDD